MRNVISVVVLVSGLMAALPAMAENGEVTNVHNAHAQHFLSKKPYSNPVVVAKTDAEQPWVGATLVVNQEKAAQIHTMKLHQLAKRGY
jgi:hypothetical protein